jgi:hypothetical protein
VTGFTIEMPRLEFYEREIYIALVMNGIKRHLLVFSNLALLLSLAFAETVVKDESMTNKMNRGRFILWSTNDESNVKEFDIWRCAVPDTSTNFVLIAQVRPSGNNSDYTYRDTSLPTVVGDACTYKIVAQGQSSNLVERTIRANNFGATVEQTWACIETVFQ